VRARESRLRAQDTPTAVISAICVRHSGRFVLSAQRGGQLLRAEDIVRYVRSAILHVVSLAQ
jgi:hypothetical protein